MKLIHLSDLHLGKRVNEFSMLEDQQHILEQILEHVRNERPDGVLIAGDVYDKSIPSADAVSLLDAFLVDLAALSPVFLISGNHDSAERLSFGGRLMSQSGVYVSPVYDGTTAPLTLRDQYGEVRIYLLPFLKPASVRRFFPETGIESYTDALSAAIGAMDIDPACRNVLVTHQFVTGAERCESEELSVGGADNVSAEVFQPFDYVALGHLHGPQSVTRPTIRYCGTPLKYSFSEVRQKKSVTVLDLAEKGSVVIRELPLKPLRDLVELRGTYEEVSSRAFYMGTHWQEDYVHIILTDEDDIPDAAAKLRTIYHGLMKLDYDNQRTRNALVLDAPDTPERTDPMDLLSDFYEQQNGQPMSDEQRAYIKELMERVREELQ